MPSGYVYERKVDFHETDAAGIVHFSNFFRYMEAAEHAFLRSLGLSVHPPYIPGQPRVGWPRVQATCDYLRPLRFEDTVQVRLLVHRIEPRCLDYLFGIHALGQAEPSAIGQVIAVCVDLPEPGSGRAMRSRDLPAAFAGQLEVAPEVERSALLTLREKVRR